jgi:hypothetical protein
MLVESRSTSVHISLGSVFTSVQTLVESRSTSVHISLGSVFTSVQTLVTSGFTLDQAIIITLPIAVVND